MTRTRAAAALAAGGAAAAILVSGGSGADPTTPAGLPGSPAPFLGTAVVGSGALTAAIDSYGSVVDLRPSGPAGESAIAYSAARQAAGTVPADTGIVIRAGSSVALPLWRAERVRQRYLPGANVVRTAARVGGATVTVIDAAAPQRPALVRSLAVEASPGAAVSLSASVNLIGSDERRCLATPAARRTREVEALRFIWRSKGSLTAELTCSFGRQPPVPGVAGRAAAADRRWLAGARPLGPAAPPWARQLYSRSLLTMRALTDAASGAVAAGAREGWAYVWPRDAAAVTIALAAAGYRPEARRIARFLLDLDLEAGVRFDGDGEAVDDDRPPQGDSGGWVATASAATGLGVPYPIGKWRGRGDYGERSGDRGDYIANAIAAGVPAGAIRSQFGTGGLLLREVADPDSGVDAAVAWAVRPFPRPPLFDAVNASLRRLLGSGSRFGIPPSEDWPGGDDPWSAPTAWVAWSLAALGERREALALLGALRRAATTTGSLPERVDREDGVALSTTPLAWSHAFAVLALRELWPPRPGN